MDHDNQNFNNAINGAMPSEDDDAASDHDSSDSVSSMSSDEIESYFVERHNRRFYSHGNDLIRPYPLPVDELEGQRTDHVHELLKEVLQGRNYFGPVQDALNAPDEGRRVRILDICTGNGKWVNEVAEEFPHAKVYGLDIVPLATRYPADNVQFEIHDINEPTRWIDGRFDLVHMRQVSLAVGSYPITIREIARILRPQGLFLSGEWSYAVFTSDGPNLAVHALATGMSHFLRCVSSLAAHRGLVTITEQIPRILVASRYFEQVVSERYVVALDNSALGNHAKQMLLNFGDSIRGLFVDSGLSAARIEEILQGLRHDLENVAGMNLVYLAVHARRNQF